MDCVKSNNQCLNTIVFPGAFAHSSYGTTSYDGNRGHLRNVYIPWETDLYTSVMSCGGSPSTIPAILAVNHSNRGKIFCIHFHGNACDIGHVAVCANRESSALHSHYLLVEYPGFGMSNGYASEVTVNQMAISVYNYVVNTLNVPTNRIVLIGRSIGTGPVCYLSSLLQQRGTPPLAVVLHSPYSSIRDAASDLLGGISYCFFDRWQNHRHLVGDAKKDPSIIQAPVLFIHADGDKVINVHHSILLHEHRQKAQLPSELFIQRSNDVYIKGHNYFDYEHDVVIPTRNFLHNLLTHGGKEDLNAIPSIVLPQAGLHAIYRVPEECKQFTEEYLMKDDQEKPSKYTPCVYLRWCLCPCIFCTEGCTACAFYNIKDCIPSDSFNYQRIRPEEASMGGIMRVIARRKSFDRIVNEEEAAKSMQRALLTKRQQQFQQQQPRAQSMDRNMVENPLVSNASMEEISGRRSRGQRPDRASSLMAEDIARIAKANMEGEDNAAAKGVQSPTADSESDSEKMAFPSAAVLPPNALTKTASERGLGAEERQSLNYVPG